MIELQGAASHWKGPSVYLLAKERTREKRLSPLEDFKCLPHCLKNLATCWATLKHVHSGDPAVQIASQRSGR